MADITITLEYDGGSKKLVFPINPSELKKEISSESELTELLGVGEVSMQKTPSLATIVISSFFWAKTGVATASDVDNEANVLWLETWQASKKPATLVVEGIEHMTMLVTCESFWHEKRAGEENTIYFELSLKEYREYGAKVITRKLNTYVDEFILSSDIPKPYRIDNKPQVENPYTTKASDSLVSLSRQHDISPYELYKKNIDTLSKTLGEINQGTQIIIVN